MTAPGTEGTAMAEYHRMVRRAACDQVVAEAERTVCLAWAVEMARLRRQAGLGSAAAEFIRSAALAGVRAEQWTGDVGALAQAQSRLEAAEAEVRAAAETERAATEAAEQALGRMLHAHEERERLLRENRLRVRSAWHSALGEVLAGPAATDSASAAVAGSGSGAGSGTGAGSVADLAGPAESGDSLQ